MEKKTGITLIKYGITTLVGAAIALPAAFARGLAGGQEWMLSARYLSDGCFAAAVLLIGFGGLCWISSTGFFDIFSYAFKSLLMLFSPLKKPGEHPSFFDYKTLKAEKRAAPPRYILFVGVGYLVASIVLLTIYHQG
jgi:hypothetical protein